MARASEGGGFWGAFIQFFLALTLVALGWGGYLYTRQQDLDRELTKQTTGYQNIVRSAQAKETADLIRRFERLKQLQNANQNKGLFAFVQFTANAEKLSVTIQQNPDRNDSRTGLIERSLQINLPPDLAMAEISRFLFKLQTWPEVKIKQVSFNKYDQNRETWGQCQVVASRFLAQEAE